MSKIVWDLNSMISANTQFSLIELKLAHLSRGMVADLGVGEGELANIG